jgi:hypothetical protein
MLKSSSCLGYGESIQHDLKRISVEKAKSADLSTVSCHPQNRVNSKREHTCDIRWVGGIPNSSFATWLVLLPVREKSGSSSRSVPSNASGRPLASQPRISCGSSSSSFISSHWRSSSAGTNRLSYSIESADAWGPPLAVDRDKCSCVDVPFNGLIDRARGGGGGICVFWVASRGVSFRRTEIGAAGVCRCESSRIAAREEVGAASPSISPRVMMVNSAATPSNSYASCSGLQGRVYRAVIVAFAVSAWATAALKSLRLIAICMLSSTE